jgi:hypothetical protein
MRHALRLTLLVTALAGLLAGHSAQAQSYIFGPTNQSGLTASDFKLLDQAAARLFARPDLAPGVRENWKNPQTRSTGSVAVKSLFQRQNLGCMAVRYEALARGRPPNRTRELNWCKTPEGWKIL